MRDGTELEWKQASDINLKERSLGVKFVVENILR